LSLKKRLKAPRFVESIARVTDPRLTHDLKAIEGVILHGGGGGGGGSSTTNKETRSQTP